MSENASKACRLWQQIFPAMDMAGVAEIVAADCLDHAARPGEPRGIEGVRNVMRFLDAAFSNQRFEVQRTVEQDDSVVVHLVHRGVHSGEIMGLPPTNREFAYEQIHILRFEKDRAVEHWGVHDHLSFMSQLGAMPPRSAAAVS
jgi:predicted ester cyclase